MLSRIGRFFRRLSGERDRPPLAEQERREGPAPREQEETEPFARDVIGRTRSIAVSDRSIHQARSVAVSDARPMVTPARLQVRSDISTEALPYAAQQATAPARGSSVGPASAPAGPTFEGDSTGDSEWDALWQLRGTARGISAPPEPAPSRPVPSSPSGSTPASPALPAQGHVQRTPEQRQASGDVRPATGGAQLIQPKARHGGHAPAGEPVPQPARTTSVDREIQPSPQPEPAAEPSSTDGEPGIMQRQALASATPAIQPSAPDAMPEATVTTAQPASVQRAERPQRPPEETAPEPTDLPVQAQGASAAPSAPRTVPPAAAGEPHPKHKPASVAQPQLQATPTEAPAADEPLTERAPAAVQPEASAQEGPPTPRAPSAERITGTASSVEQWSDAPYVEQRAETATSGRPVTVQRTAAERTVHPEIPTPPLRTMGQEANGEAYESREADTGLPEQAIFLSPRAETALPPAARAPEPGAPSQAQPPDLALTQELPAAPRALTQPQASTSEQGPSAPSVQRAAETVAPPSSPELRTPAAPRATIRRAAPEPRSSPGPASAGKHTEVTEPAATAHTHRASPPPASSPEQAADAEAVLLTTASAPVQNLEQQHVDRREALRQALQPRIVPTIVQRAAEDTATEQAPSATAETAPGTDREQGPDVEALARDVYRILKNRLLVERERDVGRI